MYISHDKAMELYDKYKDDESMYSCPVCKGSGLETYIVCQETKEVAWDGSSYCDQCEGYGKVDWITNIKMGGI